MSDVRAAHVQQLTANARKTQEHRSAFRGLLDAVLAEGRTGSFLPSCWHRLLPHVTKAMGALAGGDAEVGFIRIGADENANPDDLRRLAEQGAEASGGRLTDDAPQFLVDEWWFTMTRSVRPGDAEGDE